MDVTVRLFAALRERAGAERLVLEDLPEPLDVAGLKRALQERHAELGDLAHVRGVLGTRWVDDATPVEAGQELSLLPPVSGGAPDTDEELARGLFEIRERPLDPEEARRRVSHPACGACVLFTGTTRARNRERDVVRLDYEAFHEMAGAEMERIYAECVQRFGPPSAAENDEDDGSARSDTSATNATNDESDGGERRLRMLTLHRTGTVEVGEPSIVIAVASPHRDAAFAACRFLIDELKARVPLWKKELYVDGHHWIGDRS